LSFLATCSILSFIFTRRLPLKIVTQCLILINFIWYAYYLFKLIDINRTLFPSI
jgi:hypothetical protein